MAGKFSPARLSCQHQPMMPKFKFNFPALGLKIFWRLNPKMLENPKDMRLMKIRIFCAQSGQAQARVDAKNAKKFPIDESFFLDTS